MRELPFETVTSALERLAGRAEAMLAPDVVMKIECSADAEPPGSMREVMYGILDRVVDCGLNGKPLLARRGVAHILARVGEGARVRGGSLRDAAAAVFGEALLHTHAALGDGLSLTLALFDPEYEKLAGAATYSGGEEELLEFIISSALRPELGPLSPGFVGVGASGSEQDALLLARSALLRPMDAGNPEPALDRLEARACSRLSRLSPDAGEGWRAFAVHIETREKPTHCAALFSPFALRRAELTL